MIGEILSIFSSGAKCISLRTFNIKSIHPIYYSDVTKVWCFNMTLLNIYYLDARL